MYILFFFSEMIVLKVVVLLFLLCNTHSLTISLTFCIHTEYGNARGIDWKQKKHTPHSFFPLFPFVYIFACSIFFDVFISIVCWFFFCFSKKNKEEDSNVTLTGKRDKHPKATTTKHGQFLRRKNYEFVGKLIPYIVQSRTIEKNCLFVKKPNYFHW